MRKSQKVVKSKSPESLAQNRNENVFNPNFFFPMIKADKDFYSVFYLCKIFLLAHSRHGVV